MLISCAKAHSVHNIHNGKRGSRNIHWQSFSELAMWEEQLLAFKPLNFMRTVYTLWRCEDFWNQNILVCARNV